MDPITLIVTALAAGAAAGLKPTAEQAVKDAYSGIKALIQKKYRNISVEALELKPESKPKRESVAEDLVAAGAGNDKELLDRAKLLLDAVKEHDSETGARLNINYEEVDAGYLKLKNAAATGGMSIGVKKSNFPGGIEMEGLSAGDKEKK